MRTQSSISLPFASAVVTAVAALAAFAPSTASADTTAAKGATAAAPVTQACLGDLPTFLTCPAGAGLFGTECRQREPKRGQGEGEHWSGSRRQGPAVFLRGDLDVKLDKNSKVSFAARYKNHKKNGRIYRFDKQGVLESWTNVIDDQSYGLSVTCRPDGTVAHMASYFADKVVGLSRSWRKSDGTLSYAIEHDPHSKATKHLDSASGLTPELARRPDELCRPVRCDVTAAPDLSGMPAGLRLPATP